MFYTGESAQKNNKAGNHEREVISKEEIRGLKKIRYYWRTKYPSFDWRFQVFWNIKR